jgi:methylmalonyl-CoA mutase
MTMTAQSLFAEFAQTHYEDWKKQAQAELKGADFAEKLLWKTPEDFEIGPIYTPENSPQPLSAHLGAGLLAAADGTGRPWRNRLQITVQNAVQANQLALAYLNRGIDEVAFDVSALDAKTVDVAQLLNGIMLPHCGVSFIAGNGADRLLENYLEYARSHGYPVAELTGSMEVTGTPSGSPLPLELSLGLLRMPTSGFRPLDLQSAEPLVTDAVADLLAQAAALVKALVAQGAKVAEVVPKIQFTKELTNQYFLEIAGLRALRLLFAEMARAYGLADYHPGSLCIHARTRLQADERAQQDPNLNLLANTTQAMSAVIGGCNVLTVLPHTQLLGPPDEQATRIAANVSTILNEESYLGKTLDPSAGSYYIEELTERVMERAWEKFQAKQ